MPKSVNERSIPEWLTSLAWRIRPILTSPDNHSEVRQIRQQHVDAISLSATTRKSGDSTAKSNEIIEPFALPFRSNQTLTLPQKVDLLSGICDAGCVGVPQIDSPEQGCAGPGRAGSMAARFEHYRAYAEHARKMLSKGDVPAVLAILNDVHRCLEGRATLPLRSNIETWTQIAVEEVEDIGGWRHAHRNERANWKRWQAPDNFDILTANLCASIKARLRGISTRPLERLRDVIARWHSDQNATRLPSQEDLELILSQARGSLIAATKMLERTEPADSAVTNGEAKVDRDEPDLEDPVPVVWIHGFTPARAVSGDSSKLMAWLERRNCALRKIARKWYVERADAIRAFRNEGYRDIANRIEATGRDDS